MTVVHSTDATWRGSVHPTTLTAHVQLLSRIPAGGPVLAVGGVLLLVTGDWLPGVCLAALVLIWTLVHKDRLAWPLTFALTYQWLQVTVGVFYEPVVGRVVTSTPAIVMRDMVLVGLASLLALACGLSIGQRAIASRPRLKLTHGEPLPVSLFIAIYIALTALGSTLRALAWGTPGFTQLLLTVTSVRLVILYVLVRRIGLRVTWLGAVLALELLAGLTGPFSAFKEPVVVATCAILASDTLRRMGTMAVALALGLSLLVLGIAWNAVKGEVRSTFGMTEARGDALERVQLVASHAASLSSAPGGLPEAMDAFVARLWAIEYPAWAIVRVPNMVPHENGALLIATLTHLTVPRLLDPDKPALINNSDLVRRFAGVGVAGTAEGTSVAFGYAAESYVDFGFPLMLVMILLGGMTAGAGIAFLGSRIADAVLREGAVATMAFVALYQFEQSWVSLLSNVLLPTIVWTIALTLIDYARHRHPTRCH